MDTPFFVQAQGAILDFFESAHDQLIEDFLEISEEAKTIKTAMKTMYSRLLAMADTRGRTDDVRLLVLDHWHRHITTVAFIEGVVDILECSPISNEDIADVDRYIKYLYDKHDELIQIRETIASIDGVLAQNGEDIS